MRVFQLLINRVRAWRAWRALRRAVAPRGAVRPAVVAAPRPILRVVSAQGVRVYSLCGCCGAHLDASATLCDGCARARSRQTPRP